MSKTSKTPTETKTIKWTPTVRTDRVCECTKGLELTILGGGGFGLANCPKCFGSGRERHSSKLVGYITLIAGLADIAVYSDSPNLSEHLANPTFRTHDGESSLGCQP